MILGTILYKRYFKETEPRKIIGLAICLTVIASFCDMIFVLRWNLIIGIPDLVWVICSSTALGTLIFAFLAIPPSVLFAKMTPAHVEATMYAFVTVVVVVVVVFHAAVAVKAKAVFRLMFFVMAVFMFFVNVHLLIC